MPDTASLAHDHNEQETMASEDTARSSATTSATNKRKREAADHEDGTGKAETGDTGRRSSNKRVSPSNEAAFLSAQNNSTMPGAGEDDALNTSTTSLDFSALSQQHGGDQLNHQNGGPDPSDATSTAAAALAGLYPTMNVPQPTDLSFASTGSAGEGDRNLDPSFGMGENDHHQGPNFDMEGLGREGHHGRDSSGQKPAVGSDEWHRVRRDNHKEVERRRRETINEGINELAKIVPGCEKNKGSILQRAVAFITQLKENEAQNIEKWTLEKFLTEQAIAELSASVDKLKNECERAWREAETWKKTCQSAGLTARGEESNTGGGSGDGES